MMSPEIKSNGNKSHYSSIFFNILYAYCLHSNSICSYKQIIIFPINYYKLSSLILIYLYLHYIMYYITY